MSWRTIVISNRCKLDLKMGTMVVRGEETKRILLDEIAVLIIENTAVSLTACLLSALTEKKIKVIFCDEKRNPNSELIPYYGSHDCSRKIKTQINWSEDIKGQVWTEIVTEKIRNQQKFLLKLDKFDEAKLLEGYLNEIEFNDTTNREGHAAKVYFNGLFGKDFTRGQENTINRGLNYGYGLILSAINREVTSNGYLTQLGLFHDNMFNFFNLSCDLMEPFRVIVDMYVKEKNWLDFSVQEKHEIIEILNDNVVIDNTNQTLLNAIKIYVRSVFEALNEGDISCLKFIKI